MSVLFLLCFSPTLRGGQARVILRGRGQDRPGWVPGCLGPPLAVLLAGCVTVGQWLPHQGPYWLFRKRVDFPEEEEVRDSPRSSGEVRTSRVWLPSVAC